MPRAVVTRKTLDSLIRAKLAELENCPGVRALPVAPTRGTAAGCNWVVPGWVGEADAVKSCVLQLEAYLRFLQSQFDIAPASAGR